MRAEQWDDIAKDYYKEIISPIINSTEDNPLIKDINNLKVKTKTAIDLGCGPGELLPLLHKKFDAVTGIDFSEKMIVEAKKKNLKISLKVSDMTNLTKFKNQFDYGFAINSILAPNPKKLNQIIREVFKVLKKGGTLFAVLPAMESYIYQAMLITENEIKKGKTQKQAKKKAEEYASHKEHDFLHGLITYENETQKALYRFEIIHRFKEAGFTNIKIKKIRYSWKDWSEAGQAYFPDEDAPWDWYMTAIKNRKN